ncbi:MAG: transporter, partial [Bacteroidales bacterium]|nr:transporter [Bacteroidales bacterium]
MGKLLTFFKNWALPIVMLVGILSYLIFDALNPPQEMRALAGRIVEILQP